MRLSHALCAAALGAVLVPATGAIAQTPAPIPDHQQMGTARSAGFYVMRVGRFKVVALLDGLQTMPFDKQLVRTTPAHVRDRMADYFLPTTVPLSTNAFLIKGEGRRILVDTGAGGFIDGKVGLLQQRLAAAGYKPEDITDIILTHFHFDHAGGLVKNGAIAFPNAMLQVSRIEAEHWFSPAARAAAAANQQPTFQAAPKMIGPYRAAGKLQMRDDGYAVAPGVTMLLRPGHTPGSVVVKLDSDGQTMLFMGDLLHSEEVQFAETGVAFAFDENKNNAVTSRRRTFAEAADKGSWLAFAHVSFPGIGHIRSDGQGYRWMPTQYGVDAIE
ncbi:MBL fold metallo-hydrolase [uncultured Sphingomonas sp.]|uniref:MBL fold metallo-hydrolase n=1 Tax=uncultured Sphingomonas sp. TaxID=158754 RepID=UPI0025F3EB94|nr:MBL fold metallo-hydrolase [uncultured Sphingomonas sp.]